MASELIEARLVRPGDLVAPRRLFPSWRGPLPVKLVDLRWSRRGDIRLMFESGFSAVMAPAELVERRTA